MELHSQVRAGALRQTRVQTSAGCDEKIRAINLKELVEIAEREGKKKINLAELGYDKLLGTGKIAQPLIVEVASFSKIAAQKLEKAGGKIVTIEKVAKKKVDKGEIEKKVESKKEG